MRPADFRDYLIDVLKNSPDVQRVEVLDDGPHPYALAATVAGRESRWQVIGQLAEGAKHDTATASVQAGPPVFEAAPVSGAPDAWLAGVVGAAEPTDVESISVWSSEEGRKPGLTIVFHNGEKAFVRLA
ncbi:hypothetical protein [Streptomyces sp.]|uniref:hypothetical protein n=1 Tax=Streptomyces sp. TaxID=1931 RepID=UPI00281264FB|nr:hypothetical protein [Streptomyces sp.]